MDMIDTLGLLHQYETPKQYKVRDFLRIVKTTHVAATIIACELYHIPSRSSCYHEFLLVHTEGFMLIVERVPANNRVQVISSSGGVARDTVTVMRAREHHEYWQSASQGPVCKGNLRWHQSSPQLLDIAFIASAASTIFRHYNLYVRQCYWYARITLDAMAGACPSCSRGGTKSFSRRYSHYWLRRSTSTLCPDRTPCHSLGHSRYSPQFSPTYSQLSCMVNVPRKRL
ncbi:hypothetical protein EDC04DRAFT_1051173 [Pisolithus marmoratus]|nr:hypothetical protein EDC04DRAFT_1051173 [Pisolithus marmoratus]